MDKREEKFDIDDDDIRIISKNASESEGNIISFCPTEEHTNNSVTESNMFNTNVENRENLSSDDLKLREVPILKSRIIKPESYDLRRLCDNEPGAIDEDDWAASKKNFRPAFWIWLAALILIGLIFLLILLFRPSSDHEELTVVKNEYTVSEDNENGLKSLLPSNEAYTDVSDMVIDGNEMIMLKPINAVPYLSVGTEALNDSSVTLIFEAAGIRADNGKILGSFVVEGDLISKGQSKSGYCAIIDSKIILGVDNSSPYLEKAIETEGYFFRQYPLVAGSQLIVNELKGRTYRRALAMVDGSPVVIQSKQKLHLNEFSELLIKMGATEAINLIGGNSYGFAVDKEGMKIEFGEENKDTDPNINYIVWKRL